MQTASKMSKIESLLNFLYWVGVLTIVQAVGGGLAREAFPSEWLFWSVGVGVVGLITLVALREIERYREGRISRRSNDNGPEDIYSSLDD